MYLQLSEIFEKTEFYLAIGSKEYWCRLAAVLEDDKVRFYASRYLSKSKFPFSNSV